MVLIDSVDILLEWVNDAVWSFLQRENYSNTLQKNHISLNHSFLCDIAAYRYLIMFSKFCGNMSGDAFISDDASSGGGGGGSMQQQISCVTVIVSSINRRIATRTFNRFSMTS